jgi:protein-S-isoprenylcysteine O-methyltransferase Ste14
VSFGVTILLRSNTCSITLAILNLVILPVYQWIEDARLIRVFGGQYLEYRSSVGGFIPRSLFSRASISTHRMPALKT